MISDFRRVEQMKYFLLTLTILFAGLKLTDFIDWSWFLVLTPFFAYILLLILVFITLVIIEVAEKR